MSTYSDLMNQAQALMAQAEQLRQQERAEAIADIRAKMTAYGISVETLTGSISRTVKPAKEKAPVAYYGPKGETWSGGPGRKPAWVKAVLAQGGDIKQYRI
jgi:DNA-binding protein H-NS